MQCDSLYTVLTLFYGVLLVPASEKGVLVYAGAD